MSKEQNEWTGERLETFIMTENTNEHLHRYCLAAEYVKNRVVLDIACGEGYGSDLLARVATSVTGVDISEPVIEAASKKYQRGNIRFMAGSTDKIPAEDNTFDVVVSFETIEHHDRHSQMMEEIKRVLKPDGILVISSPDKRYYSDKPAYSNPFHIKELYHEEFEALIRQYFKEAQFLKQKHVTGSFIVPLHGETYESEYKLYHGNYSEVSVSELEALYSIAIASDLPVTSFNTSFFDGNLVLESQFKELRDYTNYQSQQRMKATREYRIGQLILKPLRILKRIFNA